MEDRATLGEQATLGGAMLEDRAGDRAILGEVTLRDGQETKLWKTERHCGTERQEEETCIGQGYWYALRDQDAFCLVMQDSLQGRK